MGIQLGIEMQHMEHTSKIAMIILNFILLVPQQQSTLGQEQLHETQTYLTKCIFAQDVKIFVI